MRNAFIHEITALAETNTHIHLVVGDLGFSVIEPFEARFPDRFLNAGVAEQNMTGMAAGMASEGAHVFTYSIANFPTFRCAEQIRNDVDYMNLPVTVVSVGGGLAYGALGYSHHAVQDYALLRTMPNMLIASPGDPAEVRACLRYLVANPCPSYLRLGKAGEPVLHDAVPQVSPGRWQPVRKRGGRRAILATGAALQSAFEWAADPELADFDLYSMPLWGLSAKSIQFEQAKDYDLIVTVEDHLLDAGFGSWLHEALAGRDYRGVLRSLGLDSRVFGMVGSQDMLNKAGGLNLEGMKIAARLPGN